MEQKEKKYDEIMWKIHDKFINEADFQSEEDYLKYFDLYIQLKYEPINLEYEN